MILSPSTIAQVLKCPHQRYLYMKLGPMPPGVAQAGGSAYHEAVRQTLKLKKDTGSELPLDSMQDTARDHFVNQAKEAIYMPPDEKPAAKKILNTELNSTITTVQTWHEHYANRFNPFEVEYEIVAEWNDVHLRGYLDLIDMSRGNNIIEWKKTGRTPHKDKYLIQSQTYAMLFYKKYGHIPNYNFFYIVNDTNLHPVFRHHRDFSFLWGCIQSALKYFNSGIFPGCSPDAWWCAPKWCGYYQVCKARHPVDYFV